jgi:SAM-dependent methyltransferase
MPRFLHVGCGPKRKNQTVKAFAASEWEEVTLDIDRSVKPDLVDKLPELSQVESNSFDAVYSAHNIEHLYPHEVPLALQAMRRVLKPDGFAILTCPDLQTIGEQLASGDIETPIYTSRRGPVAPLDMMYGFRPAMAEGNLYMAHHTGFTLKSLSSACVRAGFAKFLGLRRPRKHDLWGLATKLPKTDDELKELGRIYLTPV